MEASLTRTSVSSSDIDILAEDARCKGIECSHLPAHAIGDCKIQKEKLRREMIRKQTLEFQREVRLQKQMEKQMKERLSYVRDKQMEKWLANKKTDVILQKKPEVKNDDKLYKKFYKRVTKLFSK